MARHPRAVVFTPVGTPEQRAEQRGRALRRLVTLALGAAAGGVGSCEGVTRKEVGAAPAEVGSAAERRR
jgi:hypothetical protein